MLVPKVLLVPMEEAENGIACATGSIGSDGNTLLAGNIPLTGS